MQPGRRIDLRGRRNWQSQFDRSLLVYVHHDDGVFGTPDSSTTVVACGRFCAGFALLSELWPLRMSLACDREHHLIRESGRAVHA